MTPRWGNTFLFQSSSNSLVSVSDPWRAFWVNKAPFKGLRFATCVASETTEYNGHWTLPGARCASLSLVAEVRTPHRQERLTQTLIVRKLKSHWFSLFQKQGWYSYPPWSLIWQRMWSKCYLTKKNHPLCWNLCRIHHPKHRRGSDLSPHKCRGWLKTTRGWIITKALYKYQKSCLVSI